MKRPHRILPAALMAGMAAVPAFTMAEMLTHAAGASSFTTTQPAAAAPSTTPTTAPTAAPKPTKSAAPPTAAPRPTATPSTHTYTGPVVYDRYGGVQATITVQGKRITAVSISAPMDDPRSANINQQAVPILQSETLQAQSANINLVSGATETTDAYLRSLQGALDKAGI